MEAWAVIEHNEPLKKISLPMPEPKGTEVLIKVTHCGVCHSDLHFWEGYYDLGGGKRFNLSDRGTKLPQAVCIAFHQSPRNIRSSSGNTQYSLPSFEHAESRTFSVWP